MGLGPSEAKGRGAVGAEEVVWPRASGASEGGWIRASGAEVIGWPRSVGAAEIGWLLTACESALGIADIVVTDISVWFAGYFDGQRGMRGRG